ncbi:hypothetical protein FPSE5266_20406 [Fusarium pseudograminearum]|nr:hypothetical protein FPSE5266_20406 [Fusarium pseudograminearum]
MNGTRCPRYPEFYRPLALGFIRVFELEPGEFADPIVGRLVPQAINGETYEALSYVWGNPRKHRDITINGVTLSVTESLHGALTAFRYRLPSKSGDGSDLGIGPAQRQVRRLWADAVCINQGDMPERISQVEQMACIYASARRVLAWLGWEEGEEGHQHTRDAIRFIHSFMGDPETGLRDARILLHLHHDLANPAGNLALFLEDDRCRFEEQTWKWEAVKCFFEIEYFHRTWIVQELGLAREAIMYTALKPAGGREVAESRDQELELDSIDWPLVGEFAKFLDYRGASLVTQLGLLSWVAHHIFMVWKMKEDGTPDCDFLTGLHWARILRVTDARDRVYGLLGHPMSVIDGDLVIKPNYTQTRGVIYTKMAANVIQKTKNLYVISLVDHEDDPSVEARDWDPQDESKLPSWVPDWHSINRTTPLDYPIAAAHVEDAEIRIEGDIEGVEGTPMPHLLTRGWMVDEISAVSRRMEATDFHVTHLTRETAKENPFWLDRVWELVFPADGPADRDALAVLETLSLALPLGTREKDQPVSKAGSNQTLEGHRRSFAAYVLEYHELWLGASEASGIDDNDDNNRYVPTRSLFDSLPAEAQAELRRRAEGATSEGFIECMTWPCMCRVVYRTMSGLVGIGSRVTRPGDLVCRMRGLSVLMALRRIKDSSAVQGTTTVMGTDAALSISCVHIGPTVMPARMRSGVVDGREFGEKAVHFRIV